MIGVENLMKAYTPVQISALLGIMVVGMIILFRNSDKAKKISDGYNSIWKFFEIILFVLVGAKLDLSAIGGNDALMAILVLLIGLSFRTLGVLCCLIKTKLTWKERIFAVISYLPKATVQASIGGIALDQGLACGNIVLTVSILSILITAPIGALLIDNLGEHLLYPKQNKLDKEIDNAEAVNSDTLSLESNTEKQENKTEIIETEVLISEEKNKADNL